MNRLQKESLNNQELVGVAIVLKCSYANEVLNHRMESSEHALFMSFGSMLRMPSFCTLVTCGFVVVTFFDNHFPKDSSELVGPGYNHRT